MSKSFKYNPDDSYDYPNKIRSRDKKVMKRMKKIIKGINNCQESGKYMTSDEAFDAEELEDLDNNLE